MIYLDYAAAAPVSPAAMEAFISASREAWGNPASLHRDGIAARDILERSRAALASLLSVRTDELIFTSGGTESNNWAIRSAAAVYGRRKKHIVSTTLEHPSVLETLKALQSEGFSVTLAAPGRDGLFDPAVLLEQCREDTFLAAVAAAAPETGTVAPADFGRMLKAKYPDTLLHIDAVQAFLKIPFDPAGWACDTASFSGHKLGAPKGIGALYIRKGLRAVPLLHGGGQENGLRSGTANPPLAAAFAAAAAAYNPPPKGLLDYAERVLASLPGITVIPPHAAPHILAFALLGTPGEVLVRILSDRGLCLSAGAACKRGKRSAGLMSMKLPPSVIDGAVRLSLGAGSTQADVDALAEELSGLWHG